MANIRATVDASRPMTEPNFSCPKDQNSWLTFRQLTGRARAICGSSRKPVALTEYDRSRNLRRRAVDTRHRHHDGDLWHRARRAAQAAAAILSSASTVEFQMKFAAHRWLGERRDQGSDGHQRPLSAQSHRSVRDARDAACAATGGRCLGPARDCIRFGALPPMRGEMV